MTNDRKSVLDSVIDWFAVLGDGLRTAIASPTGAEIGGDESDQKTDLDIEGWLHRDPFVSGNPASRYGDDAPGYLTENGLGSLEIGAADD